MVDRQSMLIGSPYSAWKVFRHRAHLDALASGVHVAPIHVQIVPTNRCQQGCRQCAYRLDGYTSSELFDRRDEIPLPKLLEIVSDCGAMGVKAIEVTGGGEPTLHPGFDELCLAVLDRGIDLGVVTNGATEWRRDRFSILSKAKWVRVSIDAGTPETYALYRRSSLEVFHEVRAVVRRLAASKGPETVVGVGFVVTAENWREVIQAAENARDDGADNIRISAAFQPAGASYFSEFVVEVSELCRQAEELSDKSFQVFNNFPERFSELARGHPKDDYCGYQRLSTYIGADLMVYRCCVLGYSRHGVLGDLEFQRFSGMWFSESTKRLLDDFDARCCLRCMFWSKNAAIAYATCGRVLHENFV